jgi:putative aminopeptidase FrvX
VKELIRELTEAFGPSGHEDKVRDVLKARLKGHVDEMRVDPMGNLIALKRGHPKAGIETHKIMLAAHMDEIGVIVSHIDDKGFMRFSAVGGVFPPTLQGSRVVFADGAVGVIGRERPQSPSESPTIDKMYIDVGASDKQHLNRKVGDLACFSRPFVDMGQRLVAKAMDDRIGCAVLLQTVLELKPSPHDVFAVFTVQEEVGCRGATTSAFGVEPDVAIALDVTLTGDTPEAWPMAVSLGAGPAIKVKDRGMLAHPGVKNWMANTAQRLGIPYQFEVLEAGSTDAMAIQTSRAGVAAGVLSIPSRYTHTPSEMVDMDDVQNAVKLLLGLLSGPVDL